MEAERVAADAPAKVPGFEEWARGEIAAKEDRTRERRRGAAWDKSLDMMTEERAERVARKLFPAEYSNGDDCREEVGREGEPCSHCAYMWREWRSRVSQVRRALIEAF